MWNDLEVNAIAFWYCTLPTMLPSAGSILVEGRRGLGMCVKGVSGAHPIQEWPRAAVISQASVVSGVGLGGLGRSRGRFRVVSDVSGEVAFRRFVGGSFNKRAVAKLVFRCLCFGFLVYWLAFCLKQRACFSSSALHTKTKTLLQTRWMLLGGRGSGYFRPLVFKQSLTFVVRVRYQRAGSYVRERFKVCRVPSVLAGFPIRAASRRRLYYRTHTNTRTHAQTIGTIHLCISLPDIMFAIVLRTA